MTSPWLGLGRGWLGLSLSAFWGFIQVLSDLGDQKPPMILLENVTGFLTSNDGQDLRDALIGLNRLGYSVDAFIVDAARFVPQSRQRLFVVGTKGDSQPAVGDTPKFFEDECRPPALADFILWNPEIDWQIRELPRLPKRQTTFSDVVEDLPLNSPAWWNIERCEYLLNQMSPKHRAISDIMIQGSETTYGTVFRRVRKGKSMAELRTDGTAGCLRTPRGGSGRQILFAGGRGRYAVRLLTARECARLMGADDFTINVPLNQALFGFGDAVCVPVIEWIARNYLTPVWQEHFSSFPAIRAKTSTSGGHQPDYR